MILTPLQKLPNNVGDLGKIIVATSFEWLPKVQISPPIWSHWQWVKDYLPNLHRHVHGLEHLLGRSINVMSTSVAANYDCPWIKNSLLLNPFTDDDYIEEIMVEPMGSRRR